MTKFYDYNHKNNFDYDPIKEFGGYNSKNDFDYDPMEEFNKEMKKFDKLNRKKKALRWLYKIDPEAADMYLKSGGMPSKEAWRISTDKTIHNSSLRSRNNYDLSTTDDFDTRISNHISSFQYRISQSNFDHQQRAYNEYQRTSHNNYFNNSWNYRY
ncbi:MAG: hypothetical protein GY830_06515 [Bacteroidetes bacterium]|nr:hypothetical protein [Bacteroidota bacterium]